MDTKEKKARIRELATKMLEESLKSQIRLIEKAMDSGAIDISAWDEDHNPMLMPKAIVSAILIEEAGQYDAKGTSFEKQMSKDIKNIGIFL